MGLVSARVTTEASRIAATGVILTPLFIRLEPGVYTLKSAQVSIREDIYWAYATSDWAFLTGPHLSIYDLTTDGLASAIGSAINRTGVPLVYTPAGDYPVVGSFGSYDLQIIAGPLMLNGWVTISYATSLLAATFNQALKIALQNALLQEYSFCPSVGVNLTTYYPQGTYQNITPADRIFRTNYGYICIMAHLQSTVISSLVANELYVLHSGFSFNIESVTQTTDFQGQVGEVKFPEYANLPYLAGRDK